MTPAFEVGTAISLTAFHRLPVEGPEGELHSHDYRVEVLVERSELDEHGMVCDLDVLAASLREVASRIEGQDLELIRPEGTESVTVEVFAKWAHSALADAVRLAGGEVLSVRVFESAVAFGGYRAPVGR